MKAFCLSQLQLILPKAATCFLRFAAPDVGNPAGLCVRAKVNLWYSLIIEPPVVIGLKEIRVQDACEQRHLLKYQFRFFVRIHKTAHLMTFSAKTI